ncbi:50S ribosomal protein L11 methyltransferase [Synechococcus sp. RSCCF101]|uniref:50S ribosomal protein L11 methyltransferase n=1 Tax=Synechococcus sp. RSCCF101 TaxID=2511069 RepID=UPI00124499B4|nr:50S ribosomal protein L11 methyltransferase [Synechococcus sp. RSCCF101]QEY33158.1 50S ribosomal protein L11 methyltransferase [Synechococcus sp. RSCCF101]
MESWWLLSGPVPWELEDSLHWLLNDQGVNRVAFERDPEPGGRLALRAWLPVADWPELRRRRLDQRFSELTDLSGGHLEPLEWRQAPEEDWSSLWKTHWRPDPVGERLLILPAWLPLPDALRQRRVIRIDPGSAFGTGSHATTRLCLEALERLQPEGFRLADLGCGSGILGLAALRLGARCVLASDVDPLAVRASQANAALNQLGSHLRVVAGSAEALQGLLGDEPADLLLCNILAPVLVDLAPAFQPLVKPGGLAILSGLLEDQESTVLAAVRDAGWERLDVARRERWSMLLIRSPERS